MKPSRESAVSPRRLTRGLLAAVVSVWCVSLAPRVLAQQSAPQPPATPTSEESRAELEALFHELFTLTMEISRVTDETKREELMDRRAALLDEIKRLKPEGDDMAPLIDRGANETDQFFQFLSEASEEIDWDELNQILNESLRGLGAEMRELTEQLEDLDIEIGPDRVRWGSRESGDRMVFTLPPELRETIKEGLGHLTTELEGVFDDSTSMQMGIIKALERVEQRSEDEGSGWSRYFGNRNRERERRIIADSVFKLSDDFDVDEDEVVTGDIFLFSGDVYVGGEVQGSVITLLGDIWVDETGSLGKDAVSLTGSVEVDGKVHGHTFALGEMVPGIFSSSVGGVGGLAILFHGSRVALQAVLLLIAFALLGKRLTHMSQHSDRHLGRDFVTGSVWLFISVGGFAVFGLALVFTVIGIPLVFVLALVLWAALLGSYFVACGALGEKLLKAVGDHRTKALWVAGLVGMAVVELPTFLYAGMRPVSGMEGPAMVMLTVDFAVKFLALAIGFGALVTTRGGAREGEPVPAGPPAVLPGSA